MELLNIGLVGFGYAGQTFHAPLIRATPGLNLSAVASSDPAKVIAALGGSVRVVAPQALIRDEGIDLAVIATPNDQHAPLALAALRAGRHVVIDKPFALNVEEAEELIRAATRGQRLLSVFHNRRWDSDFLTLQQVVASGRLGRPVELVSHFDRFRPQVRKRWREGCGPGAGLWMDPGPHLVDQALQLFGKPSAIALDLAAKRDGALSDDWFHAQLRWTEGPHAGLRAHLHASMLAARPGSRFTLHGTAGSFTVEGLEPQENMLKAGPSPERISDPSWGMDTRRATLWRSDGGDAVGEAVPLSPGSYPRYYAAIRDAIHAGGECPVTAAEALWVQIVLDAGKQSVQERREIILPFDD
ncbi:MAG TPA: oxidoreductase [Burkholderiales bacterium]|nr:oxidoreductase [Burkholderiales bacterium]